MLLIDTGTKKLDGGNTSDDSAEEDDQKLGEGEEDGQWKQAIEKVDANTID